MTGPHRPTDYLHQGRHDRLLDEWMHDPYRSKHKLKEPTLCPTCGALFHAGHWQWGDAPADAERVNCPACQRIQERVPAGFLTLSGGFVAAHREEILNLAHNVESREKAAHPLKRIMGCEDQKDGSLLLTFTEPHLARAVGEAIQHAYNGELDLQYQQEEYLLRVRWRRD